jgi:hypothetical protein
MMIDPATAPRSADGRFPRIPHKRADFVQGFAFHCQLATEDVSELLANASSRLFRGMSYVAEQ